jgi:hypothetical protein
MLAHCRRDRDISPVAVVKPVAVDAVNYVDDHHAATEALISNSRSRSRLPTKEKQSLFKGDEQFSDPPRALQQEPDIPRRASKIALGFESQHSSDRFACRNDGVVPSDEETKSCGCDHSSHPFLPRFGLPLSRTR